MREYELMVVLQPDLGEEGVATTTERVSSLITSRGGEITKTDVWGRRRMAYPIRRHLDGHYTITRFKLDGDQTEEIDRNLRLTEPIMRHLIVRAEDVPTPRPIRRIVSSENEQPKEQ